MVAVAMMMGRGSTKAGKKTTMTGIVITIATWTTMISGASTKPENISKKKSASTAENTSASIAGTTGGWNDASIAESTAGTIGV